MTSRCEKQLRQYCNYPRFSRPSPIFVPASRWPIVELQSIVPLERWGGQIATTYENRSCRNSCGFSELAEFGIRRAAIPPHPVRPRPRLSLPSTRLIRFRAVPLQYGRLSWLHQDRCGRNAQWSRTSPRSRLRRTATPDGLVVVSTRKISLHHFPAD